jgi:predicted DNA-binding transcriptional regulator YafY
MLTSLHGILGHMSNPSARMLRLLSLLQTHRFWPGTELADRLEVSPRTVRRDVDRLRDLGYPVDASRGVAGGYQLQAGAALPPLLLDDEEAVAIAVGLRAAAAGAIAGIEETSVRALAKLVQVMPPRLRRRVDALRTYTVPAILGGPRVDALALTVIAQACRDGERLRFAYTARDSEPARRHVEPHRLVALGRRWYLVAWDVERGDWRMFRVDRLSDPATTGGRFRHRELPDGSDAADFVRARLAQVPRRYHVEVVFRTDAATVEAALGGAGTVEPIDDTSCRLRMNVDSLDWPAAVLGMVGADFEVVGPPELHGFVREVGTRLLASASAQRVR